MPSTREQKAKEKLSSHSDMMSDIENLDMIFENLTENSPVNGNENERSESDAASVGPQENTVTLGEDFRFLLNSISRGN